MDEDKKRTVNVMLKLNEDEKKMLDSLAKRRGQSLSAYIRQLIYEKYRSEVV